MKPAFLPEKSDFENRFLPEPNTGCWIWLNAVHIKNGYGHLSKKLNGQQYNYRAHRLAYELYKAPIPDGMVIDHKCRVRCCVNPDHLEVVTQRENTIRGEGFPGFRHRQTHCVHGHLLEGQNVYSYRGYRQCRACNKIRDRKRNRQGRRNYLRQWRKLKKEKINESAI